MAGAKTKSNGATNGAASKSKPAKAATPSPSASGTATPSLTVDDGKAAAVTRVGKPDKAAYDAEQESLKVKIAELQEKLNGVQNKINAGSGSGPGADRRAELRTQWDEIRQDQGKIKNSRSRILEQLKAKNEEISKKIKDIQAAKSKTQFKTVAEVDAHIKQLDKQVESGNMKLAEEKRALQEISQCRRLRKTVENFEADQQSIERDRATADELRKQLDDPESKAVTERADAIKAELDQLRKEGDAAHADRNELFGERNALKVQLDVLFSQKRESALRFREENDRFWQKANEDRARRAERARAQRQAEEDEKKKEAAARIREEAEAPAFQDKIEDCQTLIDFFSGKVAGGSIRLHSAAAPEPLAARSEIASVPKLELRQVESAAPGDGVVLRKKKGEDEETYFIGGKGKGKGKKGGAKAQSQPQVQSNGDAALDPASPISATPSSGSGSGGTLNVPLSTLTALLALSIPPPGSAADVPRCIADLRTKQAWFVANQARITAENVAKAEANIQRLLSGGKGENPPEPAPTPAESDGFSTGVPSEEVDAVLEDVKDVQEEVEAEAVTA